MDEYITVRRYAEASIEEKKSVFIASVSPVHNEEDAVSFINSVKHKYPDAKHNVYAYVLRENSVMRYSDDKEPSGTAGLPILEYLRKNEICDIALVVTRYFGGILLGTGGLSRAYSEVAKMATEEAEICVKEKFAVCRAAASYSDYQKIRKLLTDAGISDIKTDFSDLVNIEFSMPARISASVSIAVSEATNGAVTLEKYKETYDFSKKSEF